MPVPLFEVLSNIKKHIAKRVAHLLRRGKKLNVIPACNHLAGALKDTIHSQCKPSSNRLHATGEGILRLGLNDHVKMIVLDGILNQPKVAALTPLGEGHALLQDIAIEFELLDYCHALTIAGTIALINPIMRQINKINKTTTRKLSFTPCPRHRHAPHLPTTPEHPLSLIAQMATSSVKQGPPSLIPKALQQPNPTSA